jgi:hypothetical protein
MNSIFGQSMLAAALVIAVSPAVAQSPQRGSSAIGVEVGPFMPAAESFPLDGIDRTSPIVQVFYHSYLAARTSLRFGAGTTNPKLPGYPPGPAVRYIRAGVDLVHKSERSLYVGAGVGIYSLRGPFDRVADGHRTVLKPGGTFFVGGEYFIRDTVSLTVEGRLHALRKFGDFDPFGLTSTFGLKKHF